MLTIFLFFYGIGLVQKQKGTLEKAEEGTSSKTTSWNKGRRKPTTTWMSYQWRSQALVWQLQCKGQCQSVKVMETNKLCQRINQKLGRWSSDFFKKCVLKSGMWTVPDVPKNKHVKQRNKAVLLHFQNFFKFVPNKAWGFWDQDSSYPTRTEWDASVFKMYTKSLHPEFCRLFRVASLTKSNLTVNGALAECLHVSWSLSFSFVK